jgi:hypothetical protein
MPPWPKPASQLLVCQQEIFGALQPNQNKRDTGFIHQTLDPVCCLIRTITTIIDQVLRLIEDQHLHAKVLQQQDYAQI